MVDKLQNLDNTKTEWKVKVRVTRMWPSISHDGNTFIRFNLILLDAENYHVRAAVYPDVWNAFANVILEGNIYEVSNFLITDATRSLRTVSSNICINFTNETIVQHVVNDDLTIPMHKFELVDIGDVGRIASSYTTDETYINTIDVMGVVENIEAPKVVHSSHGDYNVVKFILKDGRYSIGVTFFGEHISSLDPLFDGNLENPVIVIIASLRPHLLHGSVRLATIQSSRIYYNLDYDDVNLLRNRLRGEDIDGEDNVQ